MPSVGSTKLAQQQRRRAKAVEANKKAKQVRQAEALTAKEAKAEAKEATKAEAKEATKAARRAYDRTRKFVAYHQSKDSTMETPKKKAGKRKTMQAQAPMTPQQDAMVSRLDVNDQARREDLGAWHNQLAANRVERKEESAAHRQEREHGLVSIVSRVSR
jgi:hypothetical protein